MKQTILLSVTIIFVFMALSSHGQLLRGGSKEELNLNQKYLEKSIEKLRGKTINDFAFGKMHRRKLGEGGAEYPFFAVLSEFGPAPTTIGTNAAGHGYLYDLEKTLEAGTVHSDFEIGGMKVKCTVVGSSTSHFCTYEVHIWSDSDAGNGGAVAAGSITYEIDDGGVLLVTGTGDDFSNYEGGLLAAQFLDTTDITAIAGSLHLRN